MWKVLLLCTNILFINKIQADCYLQGIEDSNWLTAFTNDPVDDFEESMFKNFSVKNIQDVEIKEGDYRKYFDAKVEDGQLLIFPTEVFKSFEINEKSTDKPEMNVRLDFTCTTGNRYLLARKDFETVVHFFSSTNAYLNQSPFSDTNNRINSTNTEIIQTQSFYQPIRDTNSYTPEFEQPSYTYNLPMPLPAKFDISTFGNTIVACDMDISNMRLEFTIAPTEDFSISSKGPIDENNKCYASVIKTVNPLRFASGKVYQITVTDTGILPRSSVVEFKVLINGNLSLPLNPQFESAYYIATYNSENIKHTISVDGPVRLKESCANVKLDILELEYKNSFQFGCDMNEVTVELISNIAENAFNNSVILLTIEAALEYSAGTGKTVLHLHLPELEQPETTTVDSCTTECPPCSTTLNECSSQVSCATVCTLNSNFTECPVEATTLEPRFRTSVYFQRFINYFQAMTYHTGYIGTVQAIAIPKEPIKYSLTGIDDVECDKNTGILKIITPKQPGYFSFEVFAEGVITKSKAIAHVHLTVYDYDTERENTKLMLVQHIVEEHGTKVNLPCRNFPDCTCTIFEQYPKTDEELFKCENGRIYASAIDREMENIVNMQPAQFTLFLALERIAPDQTLPFSFNTKHLLSKRNVNAENNSRAWVSLPAKVFNEPDRMLLTIIIDDINDNPPTFESAKLVIGYPVKDLAILIAQQYLAQVVAKDADVGENATIRYSTKNPHFIVHPETGVIYPRENGFDNKTNLTFVIKATDRNGTEDGISTDLEVEVKLLQKEHILVMKIENMMLEDIDDIMKMLSKNINMTIKYLTATVTSANASSAWFVKTIIYGLNAENEPVNADDLQNLLQRSQVLRSSKEYKRNAKLLFEHINHLLYYDKRTPKNINAFNCIAVPAVISSMLLIFIIIAATAFHQFKNNRRVL